MARTNNLTNFLTDVSSAIKQKTGDNTPIPASDFDTEILSIETGGNYQSKTLNVAQNGNYNLLPDTGYDAISDVSISVSVSPILQNKTITENGSYTADQNYDGLGTVIVNVQGGTINNQDKTITQNGTYTADSGYTGLGEVTVNVSSGSGDVKLFDTVEHMQADPDASEGDLAVVYGLELAPWEVDTEAAHFTFADTITFKKPLDMEYISIYFECVGEGDVGTLNFSSYESYIEFEGTRIEYESNDYQTFTRKSESVSELTTSHSYKYSEASAMGYEDVVKQLILADSIAFNGFYEYMWVEHTDKLCIPDFDDIGVLPETSGGTQYFDIDTRNTSNVFDVNKILSIADKIYTEKFPTSTYTSLSVNPDLYIDEDGDLCVICMIYKSSQNVYYNVGLTNVFDNSTHLPTNQAYCANHAFTSSPNIQVFKAYKVDLENQTYTEKSGLNYEIVTFREGNQTKYFVKTTGLKVASCITGIYRYNQNGKQVILFSSKTFKQWVTEEYAPAPSQLKATPDQVGKDVKFMGNNGVEIGTLGVSASNKFDDGVNKIFADIQDLYDNMTPIVVTDSTAKNVFKGQSISMIPTKSDGTILADISQVTNMYLMFNGCTKLKYAPAFNTAAVTNMTFLFRGCKSLTHVPAYNTMNVTNMAYMFSECTNLSNIPMMDLSNVTNLYSFINGCDLTNDSKENIMAMCVNATNYAGTKSLTELGVSYEDVYNWEILPGYTAFNAAGWSTM